MINKVIKIHMRHLHAIVYLLILSLGTSALAQTKYLPDNLNLSFNGKFISHTDNTEFRNTSENGLYGVTYEIGKVTDEQREILNFKLFKQDKLEYSLRSLPGSDVYVSNSGYVAVMNMNFHFKQELTVIVINQDGKEIYNSAYKYASLFGFSPSGNKFVVGTDKKFSIIDLIENQTTDIDPCSKFAFSEDESILATARENELKLFLHYQLLRTIQADLFYPRGLAFSNNVVAIIGKKNLKVYSIADGSLISENELAENFSYRDIKVWNNKILAGVHYKSKGISKGILHVFDLNGNLIAEEQIDSKKFRTFNKPQKLKSTNTYDPIPWPFFPFDTIHKVWNHYEQHMGDGSGDWSYLHQGLDLEVPINEPVYAVEEGWVKLVLTLGGASYWRLAISPEQSSGYSDGWLYAHLVQSSIQVDVGDYVEVHDYLGDIIYWAEDWGHIHFVNIHDQGEIWYYDDDEWGINFNPLLALTPNSEDVPPVIENFSSGSKFGFYSNESSNYLDPDNLSGDVDIIAKISEYHGSSEWEQPAFKTYYWLNTLPEDTTIFPKTLGQILNHTYLFYESASFFPYANIIYKKDWDHPSPPWMNWDRNYYQILTNNNGDSIIELSEAQLAFPTADYPDGDYRIFVEAWDEAGNMVLDSMDITFDNFNTGITNLNSGNDIEIHCYPNPAKDKVTLSLSTFVLKGSYGEVGENNIIKITNAFGQQVVLLEVKNNKVVWDTKDIQPGVYFYSLKSNDSVKAGKLVIAK